MPQGVPYWLVNVHKGEWPDECPRALKDVNEKDRKILSTPDADYQRNTWAEIRKIIKDNRIDLLQRVPSDLRSYILYNHQIKSQYGSVMNFVLQERLHWKDLTPDSQTPFEDPSDYKILYNDWPYGIDKKIVHLVIWTKFDLEEDPATGDLTLKTRKSVEEFVGKIFAKLATDQVVWFKNWKSLKSIHAVEHFHVMLYDPPAAFVQEITGDDRPLSSIV
ncbi:hypothetical protein MMC25_004716 [Agyrium rufum]|nr:hypothetical protein [Agyrium rufum]